MRIVVRLLLALACIVANGHVLSQPASRPPARAWIGVMLGSVDISRRVDAESSGAELSDLPEIRGALITGVVKEGPADRAGIRAGDVVLDVNGELVSSSGSLVRSIAGFGVGEWIEIGLFRGDETRRVSVRLGSRPSESGGLDLKRGWAGVTGIDVPAQLQDFWGGEVGRGVLVGRVLPTGPAEIAGLLPGDLILTVGEKAVANARQLHLRIAEGGVGNSLDVEVSRQGTFLVLALELVERPPREVLDELEQLEKRLLAPEDSADR